MIPFNKPYLTGNETKYIAESVNNGKISGNGIFTQKCHDFFEKKQGFKKCLLTTSCTDALEMASLLLECGPGDEVIIPSYTFTSTANPFLLRGAKVIFADSQPNHPNIDVSKLGELITERTKAIVVVHYAGMSCDMGEIMKLSEKHGIYVVEDAAQAVDSYYNDMPLGSIGHLAAFSFHETKNIISGEGGMLVINDEKFIKRSEIIWEKGTNRAEFFRGEIDKYGWVDLGSSYLPSEIVSAFLYAQLENLELIQRKRIAIWKKYFNDLQHLENQGLIGLPKIPDYATNNAHLFYIMLNNEEERNELIEHLRKENICAVFHYLPLHESTFYKSKHDGRSLPNTIKFSKCLLRLPLFVELGDVDQNRVISAIHKYFS